jgi:hypothetical protein
MPLPVDHEEQLSDPPLKDIAGDAFGRPDSLSRIKRSAQNVTESLRRLNGQAMLEMWFGQA